MSTMGFWGLLFLQNSTYWRQELEKHNFHIEDTYKEENTTVFLAKKD
jgi:hypothetical protein